SVVQGIERHLWKWAATVSGTKMSGYGSTRDEAIGNAKKSHRTRYPEATLQAGFRWRRSMTISRSAAARAALACALISVGGAAVAQGAPRQRSQRSEESRLFKRSRARQWAANSLGPSRVQSYGQAIAPHPN